MLVPLLLAAMIAVLLAHGFVLRRRACRDEPAHRATAASSVQPARAHTVDARHWSSAYWE